MGKLIIESECKKINTKKIAEAVYKYLNQKDNLKAELICVSEEEIKNLNKNFRNIDNITDVLSFPTLDNIRNSIVLKKDFPFDTEKGYLNIGSIAICEKRCAEQAEEYGHSVETEMNYLTLHGILHLMGYDHMTEEDKKEMREIEKAVLKSAGLGENE